MKVVVTLVNITVRHIFSLTALGSKTKKLNSVTAEKEKLNHGAETNLDIKLSSPVV